LHTANQTCRNEIAELKTLNSDAINTRDALRKARIDVECLESKIRALEGDCHGQLQVIKLQVDELAQKVWR
jgi:hypothetical protein